MKSKKRLRVSSLLVFLFACSHVNGKGDADEFAKEWISTHLAQAQSVSHSCQSRDTDDNGYVSCTVVANWSEDDHEVIPIECAVNRAGSGCDVKGCRPLASFGIRSRKK